MYSELYNAFMQLFEGAPSYITDYVLPITISIIFLIVIGVIVCLLFKIPKMIIGNVKLSDIDIENKKPRRKRFK